MTPRYLPFVLAMALTLTGALAACGGDDDDSGGGNANLTDPRDVPTATPWSEAPEVVILDPNNIQPLPPSEEPDTGGEDGEDGGGETQSPAAGQCGETYTVQPGDTPSGIAERCGITTQELLDANPGLDPRAIHAGDEINIPQGGE